VDELLEDNLPWKLFRFDHNHQERVEEDSLPLKLDQAEDNQEHRVENNFLERHNLVDRSPLQEVEDNLKVVQVEDIHQEHLVEGIHPEHLAEDIRALLWGKPVLEVEAYPGDNHQA